ncbi:phage portal protein [Rhizobium laguerreae]|uniref:phage portal protein n=1 Tax=Rhizobium laguerreae TaxID=1076926 RepID=UPI001C90DAEE|nr:phage portal protein [Rhizobium laguerreae]MBY3434831.1 phage portal protein [Rhizobium laguerreae]MBY3448974.1 phage portal protein [Rhizobium laguerreae]MBY3456748.1 phage portal protein [Rhizobium laguerreae]
MKTPIIAGDQSIDKPRIRVKAGSQFIAAPPTVRRARAQYLRDNSSGILTMRRAVTRDGADSVRVAAERASALAWDFIHNSGWIAGAVDQIITDTIGDELKLSARPLLSKLGWSSEEITAWARLVEEEWYLHVWRPQEYSLNGTRTLAEDLDGVIRYYLAGGEAVGVIDYMPIGLRKKYGIKSGTKVSLIAPHRLKRETNENVGLDQGIFHDENGRPTKYRMIGRKLGMDFDVDVPAWNGALRRVVHVMDRGDNPDSVRGISVLAPILKVAAQYDQLADATLTTALLQTAFAATIKSPEPSIEAFQAIQELEDDDPDLADDLMGVWTNRIDALKENGISMSDHGKINHLGPGEEFHMHTAATPGSQYIPFSQNLQREMARRLGVTFESFAMDHSNANYSSVRMAMSSVWPIVTRRRERIAAPFCQAIYESWLDEKIGTGAIPFKSGYEAFVANRELVCNAEWPGPAQPVADDYKATMAAAKRIELGLSATEDEAALMGRDASVTREKIAAEIIDMEAKRIPSPYGRSVGGGGPLGAAMPSNATVEAA